MSPFDAGLDTPTVSRLYKTPDEPILWYAQAPLNIVELLLLLGTSHRYVGVLCTIKRRGVLPSFFHLKNSIKHKWRKQHHNLK